MAEAEPAPTQGPGGGEYETPTRPLALAELVKIHRELDYVQRFTNRYASLFESDFFGGSPDLVEMAQHIAEELVAMQASGPATQAHCTKKQLQLLTAQQVEEYIQAVAKFSDSSLRAHLSTHAHARNFPHWEHDHMVLIIMRDGLRKLLKEITPHAEAEAEA